ncbi:MAG: hypothetical protein WC797_02280 [Candidatus Paceibacterota bacterium]|jgi:hypothetical protein
MNYNTKTILVFERESLSPIAILADINKPEIFDNRKAGQGLDKLIAKAKGIVSKRKISCAHDLSNEKGDRAYYEAPLSLGDEGFFETLAKEVTNEKFFSVAMAPFLVDFLIRRLKQIQSFDDKTRLIAGMANLGSDEASVVKEIIEKCPKELEAIEKLEKEWKNFIESRLKKV